MTEITVQTTRSREAIDITDLIEGSVAEGLWLASVPHTTSGLVLSEADDDLLRDLERTATELLAPLEPYRHAKNNNPNAAAHLFASLLGSQLLLPVQGGHLTLGTHQRVVFVELDGPRTRTVRLIRVN